MMLFLSLVAYAMASAAIPSDELPLNRWTVETADEADNHVTTARFAKENGAGIMIACVHEGRASHLSAYFGSAAGFPLAAGAGKLSVQVDARPARIEKIDIVDNGTIITGYTVMQVIYLMQDGKTLAIRFEDAKGVSHTERFPVSGSDAPIKEVLKVCQLA